MSSRMSDADAERAAAALLEVFRHPPENTDVTLLIGEAGSACFRRLAEVFVPALVRWQAGEVRQGTNTTSRTLAVAAFCGWMIANDALNTDFGDRGSETSLVAFKMLMSVAEVYGRLVATNAELVADAELGGEPRTN